MAGPMRDRLGDIAGKGGGEQPWGGGECLGGRRGGRGLSGDWRRWEWKGLMLWRGKVEWEEWEG